MPQASFAVPQTFLHALKDVSAILLERQEEVFSEHQADLFDIDVCLAVPLIQHFEHYVAVGPIIVELRTLVGIRNIFQEQWMESKQLSEGLQYLHFMDTPDIHPSDSRLSGQGQLVGRCDGPLLELSFPIFIDRDRDLLRLFFTDMDQCAGREPRLAGMFMHRFHNGVSFYAYLPRGSRVFC